MKKLLIATMMIIIQMQVPQAKAMILDPSEVGLINSICFYGFDDKIEAKDAAECFFKLWVTMLPTMLIGDMPIAQNSYEYIALSIDQAQRTINGEVTTIFGTDKNLATQFLNSLKSLGQQGK